MKKNRKNQPAKPFALEWTPMAHRLETIRKEVEAVANEIIRDGGLAPHRVVEQRLLDELAKVNVAMFEAIAVAQKVESKVESEQLVVGDIVRFREVVEAGDEEARFEVVELRGERILLRTLDAYWQDKRLIPTTVVPTADVVKVEG